MKEVYLVRGLIYNKGKFLLLKSAKDSILPENVGKWEAPGGRIDKTENKTAAVLREIKEETGLKCFIMKEMESAHDKYKNVDSYCNIYLLKPLSTKVSLSPEHSEYTWFNYKEIKKLPLVKFADLLLPYFKKVEGEYEK